jgi:hypothetical protein
MVVSRRWFVGSLLAAPAIVRASSLMAINPLLVPSIPMTGTEVRELQSRYSKEFLEAYEQQWKELAHQFVDPPVLQFPDGSLKPLYPPPYLRSPAYRQLQCLGAPCTCGLHGGSTEPAMSLYGFTKAST